MLIRTLITIALLSLLVGCAHSDTFEITVINQSATPLSVGLVKNGQPVEKGWDSPEQIAINAPSLRTKHWGTLIPPQSSAQIGPQTGSFNADTRPFLRIYAGDRTIEEFLAIGKRSGNRITVPVAPGKSKFIVKTEPQGLTVSSVRP